MSIASGSIGRKSRSVRAVPRDGAHQRAERPFVRVHLDVQVDAPLGADDAQVAEAGDRARARQQLFVDLVDGHPVARDGAEVLVELARRAERDDAAVVDDGDAVAQLPRLVEQVGREDDRLAALLDELAADQQAQVLGVDRVDRPGRLVEEQDRRVRQQRARHRHAARASPTRTRRSRRSRCDVQVDALDALVDALRSCLPRQPHQRAEELEVLAGGEPEIERALVAGAQARCAAWPRAARRRRRSRRSSCGRGRARSASRAA